MESAFNSRTRTRSPPMKALEFTFVGLKLPTATRNEEMLLP
jgi:hypothetical protein